MLDPAIVSARKNIQLWFATVTDPPKKTAEYKSAGGGGHEIKLFDMNHTLAPFVDTFLKNAMAEVVVPTEVKLVPTMYMTLWSVVTTVPSARSASRKEEMFVSVTFHELNTSVSKYALRNSAIEPFLVQDNLEFVISNTLLSLSFRYTPVNTTSLALSTVAESETLNMTNDEKRIIQTLLNVTIARLIGARTSNVMTESDMRTDVCGGILAPKNK